MRSITPSKRTQRAIVNAMLSSPSAKSGSSYTKSSSATKAASKHRKSLYSLSKKQKYFVYGVGILIFVCIAFLSFGAALMESSDFIGWIIFSVVVGGLLGWLGGAFVGVILYFFNLIARKEPVQEEISSSDAFEDATSEAERKPTPDEALAEIDRMNAKIFINEFQDSLNIMQKTANPETFFSRYDLVLERLDNMIELQQRGIKFTCDLPSLKTQALDEETTAETVNVLIDNAYAKQVQKLSTLKTERGRSNSTQRWYASFEPFLDRMPLRSKTYLEMKHTALQEV